jgi:hypothetical protein
MYTGSIPIIAIKGRRKQESAQGKLLISTRPERIENRQEPA